MWRFGRRLHISWLIATSSLSFVFGIFIGQYLPVLDGHLWLIVGIVVLSIGFISGRVGFIIFVVIGGCVIGLWRAGDTLIEYEKVNQFIGKTVIAEGTIEEDPTNNSGKIGLIVKTSFINAQRLAVSVYVTVGDVELRRGDTVRVSGIFSEGFGSYQATIFRAEVLETKSTHDVIVDMRDWFSEKTRSVISEPAASLGLGFVIGEKSQLPVDLAEALRIAGLTHVVVASGYNLTILVRLSRRLFMKISKFSATLMSILMILVFIGVTGFSPSMTRAGLVAGFSLAAWYYGRRFHPFVLLSLTAAISVTIKPSYVWNDVGWALSFAAFIGVMIGAPLIQKYFFGDKKPGILRQILGETAAAHILTMPIIMVVFSQISHVAIIGNMLVLPLVPLVMLLTFLATMTALIMPLLSELVSWIVEQVLNYMIAVIYFVSDLSWAKSDVSVTAVIMVVGYVVIATGLVYIKLKTKLDLRQANLVE